MPVKNVQREYPPCSFTEINDTMLPHQQSVMMEEQFKQHDRRSDAFMSIPNGEYGLGGGDPEKIDGCVCT